jgi:hypothetical protein
VRRENIVRWRNRECEKQRNMLVGRRQSAERWRRRKRQKEEAEWKAQLAREKRLQEETAAEEAWQQAVSTGLSGLKLTIPAPSVISRLGSGSSTQSKGKRKATEETPSSSMKVFLCFSLRLLLMPGRIDRNSLRAMLAQLLKYVVSWNC